MRQNQIEYERQVNIDNNSIYFTNVQTNNITVHMCVIPYVNLFTFCFVSFWHNICHIQGAFDNNFPGFSSFGFRRKLARTKTQKGTDKASEHNRRKAF